MKWSLTIAVVTTATCLAFPAWTQEGDPSDKKPGAKADAEATPKSDSSDEKAETPTGDAKKGDTAKDAPAKDGDGEQNAESEDGKTATDTAKTPATENTATSASVPSAADAAGEKKADGAPESKTADTAASVSAEPAAAEAKTEPAAETGKDKTAPPKDDAAPAELGAQADEAASKAVLPPEQKTLGLSPGAPEIAALPGGVTPAFGSDTKQSKESRFEFHGMVFLPLRFGINKRENPGAGQKETVLHAPPRVPGDFETFAYTTVIPEPWSQLNFSYGNQTVMANVIVAARTVTSANGYFDPPDMLGINDAFLTFTVPTPENLRLQFNLGAFANRYGNMGEYDLGRYGTPLIGRVSGTGLTGTGMLDVGELTLTTEVGFQGQLTKAPVGVEPAGWNGFADPNVGSSFAGHAHLGFNYKKMFQLNGHFIKAFTRDDRSTTAREPEGGIRILGVDTRLSVGRFGHLYLGYAHTAADAAGTVSSVVRVLNAPGGPGLIDEYLGPDSEGDGALNTFGGQFDLSLGNLLRYPSPFEGNGPDLLISGFLVLTNVSSPNDNVVGEDDFVYDGVNKLKLGGELGYSALSWLALGFRYDHVMNDTDLAKRSQGIITGRLILHSDWNSQDQVVIQYSHYRNGSLTAVREGYPPADRYEIEPDAHVLSITASMWW